MSARQERLDFLAPPGRYAHAMAYDAARPRVVLFGGAAVATGDTWEWDGKNWTQIKTVTSPLPRGTHAMAYDSARKRTILFGGWQMSEERPAGTWQLAKPTLTTDTSTVSITKGGVQKFTLDAGVEHGGRSYWMFGSVTGTTPGVTLGSAIGSVHIPLHPDIWTDYTIALANTAILAKTKGSLDGSGGAQASFNIPKVTHTSTIGLMFYHAYLVYDAKLNFHMASNAVVLGLVK